MRPGQSDSRKSFRSRHSAARYGTGIALFAPDGPGRPYPDADDPAGGRTAAARPVVFANGFTLSPYAETGSPGGSPKNPPRTLWHASPGSTSPPT